MAKISTLLLAFVVASICDGSQWLRTPSLWPTIPDFAWRAAIQVVSRLDGQESQEVVALAELAVFSFMSLAILSVVAGAALWGWSQFGTMTPNASVENNAIARLTRIR